jgi:tetratricopeptide (TPR) repeat protein
VALDPSNPVVRLCVAGLACENDHRFAEALDLYTQAWNLSSCAFESCIAAHYVARQQKTAPDALRWNLQALRHANAIEDDRAQEFYPSLYLNVGKSYEELGNTPQAKHFYEMAATELHRLPTGPNRNVVQDGIERGLKRVS